MTNNLTITIVYKRRKSKRTSIRAVFWLQFLIFTIVAIVVLESILHRRGFGSITMVSKQDGVPDELSEFLE